MRQTILVALLSACLTLLAVDVVVSMGAPGLRTALGQAAGAGDSAASASGFVLASANTQNEVFLWLYDIKGQKLASYSVRQGIELKGVRSLKYDLDPELNEYPPGGKTSVENIKKAIEEARKKK
jgi:hypothetical protein